MRTLNSLCSDCHPVGSAWNNNNGECARHKALKKWDAPEEHPLICCELLLLVGAHTAYAAAIDSFLWIAGARLDLLSKR
jgi:hypothetical protein